MPSRAQTREEKLVLACALGQFHHAAGDGTGIGAGSAQARRLLNVHRQRPQAVPQLAGILVRHAFTQKTADIAK